MTKSDLASLSLTHFAALLDQPFRIEATGHAFDALLIEVKDLRENQGAGSRSHQFSLTWRGPAGLRLDQGIYPVSHPELGSMELFLVCIGPDELGMRHEAVFT